MERVLHYLRTLKNNKIIITAAACVILFTASAVFFLINEKSDTISIEEADLETAAEERAGSTAGKDGESKVYVDVSGCVKKPGVYEVSADSRIFEVIELAGGVTPDADTSYINQAEPVTDGLKINVPDRNQTENSVSGETSSALQDENGKVNINTADMTRLQDLPGVGPVTAEKIISHRENNGYFRSIEDIKNVSGIGEKTFEKIKDMISV